MSTDQKHLKWKLVDVTLHANFWQTQWFILQMFKLYIFYNWSSHLKTSTDINYDYQTKATVDGSLYFIWYLQIYLIRWRSWPPSMSTVYLVYRKSSKSIYFWLHRLPFSDLISSSFNFEEFFARTIQGRISSVMLVKVFKCSIFIQNK